jgi:hypothetical protein
MVIAGSLLVFIVSVVIVGVIVNLLSEEASAQCPRLAAWIVRRASDRLPEFLQARYEEEWLAHVAGKPGPLSKLFASLSIALRSPEAAKVVRTAGSSGESVDASQEVLSRKRLFNELPNREPPWWREHLAGLVVSLTLVVATIVANVWIRNDQSVRKIEDAIATITTSPWNSHMNRSSVDFSTEAAPVGTRQFRWKIRDHPSASQISFDVMEDVPFGDGLGQDRVRFVDIRDNSVVSIYRSRALYIANPRGAGKQSFTVDMYPLVECPCAASASSDKPSERRVTNEPGSVIALVDAASPLSTPRRPSYRTVFETRSVYGRPGTNFNLDPPICFGGEVRLSGRKTRKCFSARG